MFYNYKGYFSIVLLAVCDANYQFTYVDIGAYGKSSDSGIFKNSPLYQKMIDESLNIPPDSHIGPSSTKYPYVFVGDEAFALSQHVLRPYGGKSLTQEKKIFNYRLSRARRYIECSFGILAGKWRILQKPLNVDFDFAEAIVKATCVLHNFVRQRDGGRDDPDDYSQHMLQDTINDGTSRANNLGLSCREQFTKYFVNIAPLPWQNEAVN